MTTVTSKVDGRSYRVRDMPDKEQAADLIARVRLNMKKLYMHLESAFPDKPQVKRLKETTGFGDISIVISMVHAVVDRGEIFTTVKRLYSKRSNNEIPHNIDSDWYSV